MGCAAWAASFSPVSLALIDPSDHDPSGQDGVREHPGGRTRTGGTEPATYPPPAVVQASVGKGGAVRPRWIPRSRRHAAPAGALTRSAAAYEVDARSLPP